MYCNKCKSETPDYSKVQISHNMFGAMCAKCGNKKQGPQKIQTVSQSGGDEIDRKISNQTYNTDRVNNIDGYEYDPEVSSKKTAVYHNKEKNHTIVGHRGTKVTDLEDLAADAQILGGDLKNSKRYKDAETDYNKAKNKYNNSTVSNTGHSLGGSLSIELGKKDNSKVEAYNPGVGISTLLKGKSKNPNEQVYHSAGDPISVLSRFTANKIKVFKSKGSNPHGLSNFK